GTAVDFTHSDEQQQLAESIRRFVERYYDFEARRRIIESHEGWSRKVWAELAELGVLALPLPADCGGYGGGTLDLVPFMHSVGDALMVEPYVATIGLCARLVARGGTSAQRAKILPDIAAGRVTMALAHGERHARYNVAHVETRVQRCDGGYRIDGDKCVVLGAPGADLLLVSARARGNALDAEGTSVFVVETRAPGVSLRAYRTIDELRAADIRFDNVIVADEARIGGDGAALPLIEDCVD